MHAHDRHPIVDNHRTRIVPISPRQPEFECGTTLCAAGWLVHTAINNGLAATENLPPDIAQAAISLFNPPPNELYTIFYTQDPDHQRTQPKTKQPQPPTPTNRPAISHKPPTISHSANAVMRHA